MRVRDYLISNPCCNTPISVPCVPCDHIIRQTHTTSFGFDIDCFAVFTDARQYEYVDPEDERTIPNVTFSDNSILIQVLEAIEEAPDLPEMLLEKLVKNYHIGNIELAHGYTYIPVSTLREELYNLYLLYICYRILVWGEKLEDIDYIWRNRFHLKIESRTYETDRDLCRAFLTFLIECDVSCNMVFIMNESGNLQRMYECNTVDDALVYQLFLHIEAGEDGLNGYSLARCKRCGSTYPQATRKFSLCAICRKPSERTRACREKKKEAQHAQENHP